MYDTGPRPDLRASDAERERVAAFLRDHAAEGRLDADELDERVGKAYAAKTVRELQALIVDLPRAPFPRPQRPRHYAPAPRRGVPPAVLPLGILAFLAFGGPGIVWAVAWIGTALALTGLVLALVLGVVLSPVLIVAAIVILALRRRRPRRWDWDPRWR